MTTTPDGQPPPDHQGEQAPSVPAASAEPAGPQVPTPRAEFLSASRQLMRGSRALITGANAGIGRVIAVGLAREGVDVAIAYAPDEPPDDAARTATLVEQEGRRCVTMRGDLADEDVCREAVNQAVAELGGIDILVNVTAIQSGTTDLAGLDEDRWERNFRSNLFSFFMATRRPTPHARRRKGRRRPLTEELIIENL
jgi:NAD(P)-dependent dehydrogenase (short-subunit alcohol dehydrogenase family)